MRRQKGKQESVAINVDFKNACDSAIGLLGGGFNGVWHQRINKAHYSHFKEKINAHLDFSKHGVLSQSLLTPWVKISKYAEDKDQKDHQKSYLNSFPIWKHMCKARDVIYEDLGWIVHNGKRKAFHNGVFAIEARWRRGMIDNYLCPISKAIWAYLGINNNGGGDGGGSSNEKGNATGAEGHKALIVSREVPSWSLGISKLLIEMDSKVVVMPLEGELKKPEEEDHLDIHCRKELSGFEDASLSHVLRQANAAADGLAMLAHSHILGLKVYEKPPQAT
ncbi:Ribonuclease H domain [Dillenia turbinata]|uniref:Ribonuclease H domain n=1 Tax=Dillenia turbinata TaxID=194707 RepID=A0AAN8UHX4_9MAGN